MGMQKKTIAITLSTLIIFFCSYFVGAVERETITIDEVTYTYSVNGNEVSITGLSTESERIIIPEQINGYTVTSIEKSACRDCTFKSIQLPDSIKTISDNAFEHCEELISIVIPSNVSDLGQESFLECISLKTIELPENLKTIGELCFGNCSSLTNIYIPEGVTKINTAAFNGCTALTTINIPDSVTEIGNVVFAGDTSLKNIDWNRTVSSIGKNVFQDTKYLSDYTEDFLLLNSETLLYRYTGKGGAVQIPESVTQIADGAFQNTQVSSVVLPSSMTVIPSAMFSGCTALTSVTIPDGYVGIQGSAFSGCSSLIEINFPESLQYIKNSVFSECSALKKLTIPDHVETIGDNAFIDCSSLTEVKLPSQLTKLGDKAFYNCNALKTINIPKGIINNISSKTFSPSAYLENVTIEGEITSTLANALAVAHYVGDSNEDMYIVNGILMSYNGTERDVVIPETVTEIGNRAFADGIKLNSVVIPSTVTRIGDMAFYGQNQLTNIEIPGSVTSIGQMAFSNCTNLKDILFEAGSGTLALGNSAFQFTAVTEETLKTNGRNYINKETAFQNTALDPDYDPAETEIPAPTETPAATEVPPIDTATPEESGVITVISGKNEIMVETNNKIVDFEDAQPFIDENERTQIPIRAVAEALDCTVDWDEQTQTVTLSKGNKTVIIQIGNANMQADKSIIKMDTTAQILNDRTYIPVRFVGEAFGMTVNWESE